MSETDENQILRNLERLSQVGPSREATDHAMQRVRDTIGRGRPMCLPWVTTRGYPYRLPCTLAKLAAAAVLLLGAGYLAGRLSAPEPVNVQELQATLEGSLKSSLVPAIRQELLSEIDSRWQSVFAASHTQLQEQLKQQVGRDLAEFAQNLAASRNLTDQRFMELVQSIEAARRQDRLRTAAALEQIELNRLRDKTRLGSDLVALAAQTNELLGTEHN
jgi:parvulin-like peptidyl-prolyl isomerase